MPFTVKPSMAIGTIKKAYARRAGMAYDKVILSFKMKRISDEQSPLELNLQDGDVIKAKRANPGDACISGIISDGPAQMFRRPISVDLD